MDSNQTIIIAIANNKGGVAKSTTTVELADYFANVQKKKVLIIDADERLLIA